MSGFVQHGEKEDSMFISLEADEGDRQVYLECHWPYQRMGQKELVFDLVDGGGGGRGNGCPSRDHRTTGVNVVIAAGSRQLSTCQRPGNFWRRKFF